MSGLSAGMGEPAPVSYLGSCVFVNTTVKVNLACKRKDAVEGVKTSAMQESNRKRRLCQQHALHSHWRN